MSQDTERISTRSLLGAFFLVVLLCAVFFSLGYFLGYKERGAAAGPATEQVSQPADSGIPPPAGSSAAVPSGAGTSPGEAASLADQQPAAGHSPVTTGAPGAPPSHPPTSETREAASAATASTPGAAAGAPPPATATPAESGPSVRTGTLVQAAALTNQQDAASMVNALVSRGYPALILTPRQAHANDNFFRVVVGPYKTRAAAEAARSKLAAEGLKPFIRQ